MRQSRADVEFDSQGTILRGWRYRPDGAGRHPAIVMAHGMTAVKEMFLDEYATRFCRAGFAVLVYDHPSFGASDGTPRQNPDPHRQIQGYRDAIGWMRSDPTVDSLRIGVWGSSFSGGEVIALAADEQLGLAAAVAQVPFLGPGSPSLSKATLDAIDAAAQAGNLDATVPAISATPNGLGVMYEDGAAAWFTRVAADRAPTWRNEICVRGIIAIGDYQPFNYLASARGPLLLVPALADTITPPGPVLAAQGSLPPTVSIVTIEGGHFDAYEAGFKASADAAVAFFTTHLRP
jgi:dienelactone hydrolase